jgi:hypothetical protein
MKNIVGFIYWGESKGGWKYDNYPFAFSKELNVSLYLYTFPTKLKSLEIRNCGASKLLYRRSGGKFDRKPLEIMPLSLTESVVCKYNNKLTI